MYTHSDTIVRFLKIRCKLNSAWVGNEDVVNYTCMYMVYAVCKHACMHMCTVHTIYTQPHMCTDTHTHTHTCTYIDIHTILLAVIVDIEKKTFTTKRVNLNNNTYLLT